MSEVVFFSANKKAVAVGKYGLCNAKTEEGLLIMGYKDEGNGSLLTLYRHTCVFFATIRCAFCFLLFLSYTRKKR